MDLKSVLMKHTVKGCMETKELALELGAAPQMEVNMSSGMDGAMAPLLLACDDPSELMN